MQIEHRTYAHTDWLSLKRKTEMEWRKLFHTQVTWRLDHLCETIYEQYSQLKRWYCDQICLLMAIDANSSQLTAELELEI